MISKGKNSSITLDIILSMVDEFSIAMYYFHLPKIPCLINSPLRTDAKPSFHIYYNKGIIWYKDFSNNKKGTLIQLLMELWRLPFDETLNKIYNDIPNIIKQCGNCKISSTVYKNNNSISCINLNCTVRDWKDYDIEYWESYGIPLNLLKCCNVYPISHKFITKDNKTYTFLADKYAYSFVEYKEKKLTMKIYQPYNTQGYKWSNSHDSSVISLWTTLPKGGDLVIICSSLKDALCVMANTNIPCIAVQGEGYSISNRVIKELNERFKQVIISFDGDKPGVDNANRLSLETGWKNANSPLIREGNILAKDWSDIYHYFGKNKFLETFKTLIK